MMVRHTHRFISLNNHIKLCLNTVELKYPKQFNKPCCIFSDIFYIINVKNYFPCDIMNDWTIGNNHL